MTKNILISIGALLVVVLALGYFNRETLAFFVFAAKISPDSPFSIDKIPPSPDYSTSAMWASLPSKQGAANSVSDGGEISTEKRNVDVFFVHPTTYSSKDNWNQPLNDEVANWVVDERILRHQASVFNSCCDIYAPRYRQATFFSFMDKDDNGKKALEVAYEDVVSAFESFNERRKKATGLRPFIIAGHSQGTKHITRLIAEKVVGSPLEAKLIVGYLVGFSIEENDAKLRTCNSGRDTHCVVGWNSVDADGEGIFGDAEQLICTNPLSWRNDSEYAGHDLNAGGIGFPSYSKAEEGEDYTLMKLEPGAADAQCIDRMLSVRELRSEEFPLRMPGSSLHVYDYSLFHMSIKENVSQRISAFSPTSQP